MFCNCAQAVPLSVQHELGRKRHRPVTLPPAILMPHGTFQNTYEGNTVPLQLAPVVALVWLRAMFTQVVHICCRPTHFVFGQQGIRCARLRAALHSQANMRLSQCFLSQHRWVATGTSGHIADLVLSQPARRIKPGRRPTTLGAKRTYQKSERLANILLLAPCQTNL